MDVELDPPPLTRALGLPSAVALNVANMIGAGPFITIPAFLAAMNGPQALVAWVIAAVLVLCDGLVWSELGAALPGSGGSYHFLRMLYAPYRWGRMLPFLFIWQFMISGTLEMASGYIAAADFVAYVWPSLNEPIWGSLSLKPWLSAAAALVVTGLLCRRIESLGRWSIVLCGCSLLTVAAVIVMGALHFDPAKIVFPSEAWRWDSTHFGGLGAAMTIAIYDYLGYYNVCHLGDEVREPQRTIPRAVMLSVVLVALVYLTMNVAIIAVVPWQEAMLSKHIAAEFVERLYGRGAAEGFTLLILLTVVACLFAMTLGYSRIAYAAARNGDFFRPFAHLHPRDRYPSVSLWSLGGLTAVFCFISLETVITAAVTVRIGVQFIGQIVGLHLFRRRAEGRAGPFRMWLYPLPSLLALCGWLFLLGSNGSALLAAAVVLASGVLAYGVWHRLR